MFATQPWHDPYDWADQYRPYRLEAIGPQLRTRDELERVTPIEVRYAVELHKGPGGMLVIAGARRRAIHTDNGAYALAEWMPGEEEPTITTGGIGSNAKKIKAAEIAETLLRDFRIESEPGRHKIGSDPADGELALARHAAQIKRDNPTRTWLRIAHDIGLVEAIEDEGRSKDPENAAVERLRRWGKRLRELGE
jgi:hypothetical protein